MDELNAWRSIVEHDPEVTAREIQRTDDNRVALWLTQRAQDKPIWQVWLNGGRLWAGTNMQRAYAVYRQAAGLCCVCYEDKEEDDHEREDVD